MKKLRYIAAALLAGASVFGAAAVSKPHEWKDSLRYYGEIGATFTGGDHTPFWMVSDNYGFSSVKRNNGWLRLGIFHDLDHEKRFSWGAGVDLAVAANFEDVFIPQQIYAEVKYRCLNAMIGQKEMKDDIIDSELSSGELTNSTNSRPIPQVRIGIFDYADFWGCKGWFAVKGYIGYGMFTDGRWLEKWAAPDSEYTKNILYCTRAIYFRGGDARQFPLVGELGLRMDTQFGGTTYSKVNANGERTASKHPNDFKAWVKGLIPMGGDATTVAGEQLNVQGNFLGNWAFSLGWFSPDGWSVKAYYEHFFEDHSMLTFDFAWKDGLWGIDARLPKNKIVSQALVEFLYMKDQSGPVYYDHDAKIPYQVSGRDFYYANYVYQAWQNYGRGIGNPLLISPIYNNPHKVDFLHTRVEAWNLGFKGEPTDQVDWTLRASVISSWGTYDAPTKRVEQDFSLLAKVNWHPARLKGWEGSLSFGMDAGGLLGHSYAVGLTISKTGFIGWK